MNKLILGFLLSVMMVYLCAFFIPLRGVNCSNTTVPVTIQETLITEARTQLCYRQFTEENFIAPLSNNDITLAEMNMKLEEVNLIEDKKDWFLAYKSLIKEYEEIINPPETIYDWFADNELDLLFRVVQAEIGDEYSFDQKANVASVIFNRFKHDRFPDTLAEILTPDQFSTISNGRYKNVEVSEDTILACEYAFQIGDTTNGCLFFDSNNKLKYKFVFNDGAHNFYVLHNKNN